jgi:hypothetical protein
MGETSDRKVSRASIIKSPSIHARWTLLSVGLTIFIGGALLLRTIRPSGADENKRCFDGTYAASPNHPKKRLELVAPKEAIGQMRAGARTRTRRVFMDGCRKSVWH